MPTLGNTRHEHFCRLRAEGKSATAAYIEAGYSENGARQSAHNLLTKSNIKARIAELQAALTERAVEKTALTESYVISGLIAAAEWYSNPASGHHNAHAAIRAYELLGKKLGLWVHRIDDRRSVQDFRSIEELRAAQVEIDREVEELEARKRELLGEKKPEDGGGTVH